MGIEIEKKYLVNKEIWLRVEKQKKILIRQGYLLTDLNKTIRIRITDLKSTVTIKGPSIGATRPEFEYEIPKEDAEFMLNNFLVTEINKTRYELLIQDKLWEVDEYHSDNLGLIIAEIELKSESEKFDLPNWIDKEVTSEAKYYNSNLSIKPFSQW
jgi:adenylate cyclase